MLRVQNRLLVAAQVRLDSGTSTNNQRFRLDIDGLHGAGHSLRAHRRRRWARRDGAIPAAAGRHERGN